MKPAAYIFLLTGMFLLLTTALQAQDKIVKINNDTIRAKVLKITKDKIQFRYPGSGSDRVSEIHKNSVKEIIYANGTRLRIIYNLYEVNEDDRLEPKKWVFKADVAAPFLNHITFGLEYCLKKGLNLEVKGGVIGPGLSSALDESEGYLLKAGVKFVYCTSDLVNGQKVLNPLKGVYLKPELMYSHYKEISGETNITYTNYAINFILGKQFIPGRSISLEFFGGLGFGIQDSDYEQTSQYKAPENDFNYVYSHIYFGHEVPIVISGGLTIGFVF